ncbi:hypothetical protein MARBORIA2_17370 [Methanobrevibacter arboriphilus]|uniref:Uncharacterized protein n=1 Tax=Methanobrevibacter arboriphilus TaxID=39441 RepID=A0ACA8R0R1_METAZ|nr:hypothetical protein [Methanobrevibacter arboriphilus]BBL61010.1 hypothetical protein MarbSA_00500 [Methanobrevibacter arboriphilus]GLI12647.1 hypothetical protein MARBORIA2_17370 [Methanobrevibacter arboriphilus]
MVYKYGKNGKSNWIWKKEKLKEWLVAGKEENINKLYDDIIKGNSIEINTKKIYFKMPDSFEKDDDIDFPVGGNNFRYNVIKTAPKFFNKKFFKTGFLNEFLGEDERNDKNIERFYPLNLFSSEFIKYAISKNIFAISEFRTPFLYLNRKTHNKIVEPEDINFIGCLETDEDSNLDYYGILESNGKQIDNFLINKEIGIFKFSVDKKHTNVVLSIKKGSKIIKKNKLYTNTNVNIEMHDVKDRFEDEWGNLFSCPVMRNNSKFSEFYWPNKNIWQIDDYPEITIAKNINSSLIQDLKIKNTGFEKLSYIFKSIFDELGTNILIIDPYFIGDLSNTLKGCQVAFINAFNIYAFENNCNNEQIKIEFLGLSSKAKNSNNDPSLSKHENEKVDDFQKGYFEIFKRILNENNFFGKVNMRFLKIENVPNIKDKFHNRYWCGLDEDGDINKCIEVTNSVGNINEVSFYLLNNKQCNTIYRKYNDLYKESDKCISWLEVENGIVRPRK